MKKILTLLVFLPFAASAQTIWPVNMGGSTQSGPAPYYSPSTLTINVNDIVRWTNVSGSHSANGSLQLYPTNPQGFSSGDPQNGSWSWQFTFTIPGVYHYTCTQEGHAATQNGTITVLNTMGVAEVEEAADLKVYPVPATDLLYIEPASGTARTATVVDLDGATVLSTSLKASGRSELSVAALAPGKYFVLVTDADGRVTTKPFTKN